MTDAEAKKKQSEDQQNIKILVVDDMDDSRQTAIDLLKSLGYNNTTSAKNGDEALKTLERDPNIGLILSDWEMPLVSGITLLKRVRSDDRFSHLPFIMMTAPISNEDEKVLEAAEHMIDAYMIKPFRATTLYDKLQHVFSKAAYGPQKEVVVVDDDPDATKTVTEYLNALSFKKIKVFDNGEPAASYIERNSPDIGLIIADWEMPLMNGVELLKFCKTRKSLRNIPFLIITSQVSIEKLKVEQAAKNAVDDYLLKPFNLQLFKQRIKAALKSKRLEKQLNSLSDQGFEDLDRGRFKAASMAFEKALKIDPHFDKGLAGMADVLFKSGDVAGAIPYYQKSIAVNPYSEDHYLKLATAYVQNDQIGKALSILQKAASNLIRSIGIRLKLYEIYLKKDMFIKAREVLESNLEIDPNHLKSKDLLQELKLKAEKKRK